MGPSVLFLTGKDSSFPVSCVLLTGDKMKSVPLVAALPQRFYTVVTDMSFRLPSFAVSTDGVCSGRHGCPSPREATPETNHTYYIMMKKALLTMCAAFALNLCPAGAAEPVQVERPRLVVGIVVDQMRWDYLYRYADRYGDGGFKRLLNDGFSCENAHLNYVPTVTAIGHTCIYTGSVPSIHGIAGNDFIFRSTGRKTYCTDDATVHGVGSDNAAGKMSPRNLLVTTLGDELHLATNFRAKVISISLKDRAAILPGGHTADAAYWFDSATGRWITSSYYRDELPAWVKAFNDTDPARRLLEQDWHTLLPSDTYTQSTADDTPYEDPFVKGGKPVFPIATSQLLEADGYGIVRETPYGNTLTLQMAGEALEHEALGQDSITDLLAVSLSSTDYVGHRFGVNAVETEDTYLRLDRDVAAFLTLLDEKVGAGNYTVFLTADHAAAHNVTFLADRGIPSGSWDTGGVKAALDSLVAADFGVQDAVQAVMNYQVFLRRDKFPDADAFTRVKQALVRYLTGCEGVMYAVDLEKAGSAPLPAPVLSRVINGYNAKRSGDIQVVLNPGWYDGESRHGRGTTHGVWCPYDTHVPILFMGWGIRPGETVREVHLTDIAATVSALLHIQMPSGCIGTPIREAVGAVAD